MMQERPPVGNGFDAISTHVVNSQRSASYDGRPTQRGDDQAEILEIPEAHDPVEICHCS